MQPGHIASKPLSIIPSYEGFLKRNVTNLTDVWTDHGWTVTVTVHSSTGFRQESEGQQRRNRTPLTPLRRPWPTLLSNMVRWWKYWICFLTVSMTGGCKISTLRRFQKYWIRKALFPKRNSGPHIQYLKKEGLLDISRKKLFSEIRNTYPPFKKARIIR